MSKYLNARFDISNSIQVDLDQWFIQGEMSDATATFTEFDIKEGDIIYNDQSWLGTGVARYKILSIDPTTSFGMLVCTIQWDIADEAACEPALGFTTIIGQADENGTTAITNASMNLIDEAFLTNARNIEAMRMSKRVTIVNNLTTVIGSTKEPKLGLPLKDKAFLVSSKAGQRSWYSIDPIDRAEKGAFGGIATLDETGKIPIQQLPADVQTDTFQPANETEMLALPAQKGDFAVRADVSKTFILSNNPATVLDNWVAFASSGGGGGESDGGNASTATISNETKRIQPFRTGATYSIGEMVMYDNLIWMARKGLFSVQSFNQDDWMLVAGNMDSYHYDVDGDGIIDRSNLADQALYAMKSDITRMIQSWMPSKQYVTGEQLVYGKEFYLVKENFTSGDKFDLTYLEPMSLKKHSVLLNLQGGDVGLEEFYHLTSAQHAIVNGLSTSNGKLSFGSQVFGDMTKQTYDPNGDGIVNQADRITGVNVSPNDINTLQGITENVQTQINSLKKGISMKGTIPTYADLVAVVSPALSDAYIVEQDENHLDTMGEAQKSLYIWNGSVWTYLGTFTVEIRNFTTNPANIVTETIGVLPDARIDSLIARKTDLHGHANKNLIDSYTFTNADFYALKGLNHEHLNLDLLETYTIPNVLIADTVAKVHEHTNTSVLDLLTKGADGNLWFEGKAIQTTTGGGGTGGGGITDLSGFTTNDLVDYTDKRYITDLQKDAISQLPAMKTAQATTDTKLNDLLLKIPSTASSANKLATLNDLASKVGVTTFKQLTDVNASYIPNAFVVVNASGTGLTYLNKIEMSVPKITDIDGNIFTNIPNLTFADMDVNLSGDGKTVSLSIPKLTNLHTTDLLDMPIAFTGSNGKVLIANETSMKYELKDIGTLTNSHANYSLDILAGDWTYNSSNGKYEKIVAHTLGSTNLIVAFYDETATAVTVPYKILDSNQILLTVDTSRYLKTVINCSQGTTGDGSGGGSGSGSVVAVTAETFIDDTRARLDKTYSSQKINDVLSSYAKKTNIYTIAQADSKFATIDTQHVHANIDALNKFSIDGLGNPLFNNKPLLTSITSATYQNHWTNQDNSSALSVVVDVFSIYSTHNFGTILNNEFTIKNAIPSVDATIDAKLENQLRLVVVDGTITIMDVYIRPQETQKYSLGISPNLKVLIKGKFDANLYIGAF